MNQFWVLYRDGLHRNIVTYLLILLAFLALSSLIRWSYPDSFMTQLRLSVPILFLLFVSLPILLSNSLKHASFTRSSQLLMGLPVRRYMLMLSQSLTIVTFWLLSVLVGMFWSILLIPNEIQGRIESLGKVAQLNNVTYSSFIADRHEYWEYLFLGGSQYFFMVKLLAVCTFVILGGLLFVHAFGFMVKHFRVIAQKLSLLLLFIFFCWFGMPDLDMSSTELGVLSVLNGIVAGAGLALLGLVLFQKYGEV